MIQAGGTNLFILFGIRKNGQSSKKSLLLYLLIRRVIQLDYNNYQGISLFLTAYKSLFSILLSRLSPFVAGKAPPGNF
jgi:hypothetical protein